MPVLDSHLFGECQSMLLNFDTIIEKEGYSAKFVGKKYTGGDYIWGSTPDPEVLGGIRTISE